MNRTEYTILPEKMQETITLLLVGAGKKVRLLAKFLDPREFGLYLGDIANVADNRLRRQILLPIPGYSQNMDGSIHKTGTNSSSNTYELIEIINEFKNADWDIKLFPQDSIIVSSLCIDNEYAIFYDYFAHPPGPYVRQKKEASRFFSEFDAHWATGYRTSILEEILPIDNKISESNVNGIITISKSIWSSLSEKLILKPELIYKISPRQFEEFIAELLSKEGLSVQLTPQTHDGGRDILAFCNTPVGKHLYYVECKRNSPNRPVDVSVVRSLHGVLISDKATAGMIVTTSYFSNEAKKYSSEIKHQMSLRDYHDLKTWISKIYFSNQ